MCVMGANTHSSSTEVTVRVKWENFRVLCETNVSIAPSDRVRPNIGDRSPPLPLARHFHFTAPPHKSWKSLCCGGKCRNKRCGGGGGGSLGVVLRNETR